MNTTLIDKAVSGLRKAATELEEFQLKLALGKSVASDKYEQLKKSFRKTISEVLLKAGHKMRQSGLQAKLEELQVQLALGKAETRDAFEIQEKRIALLIREIEHELEKLIDESEFYLHLRNELVKFKIMLELLRVHFELGKMEMRDDLEEQKETISKKIDGMIASYKEKSSGVKDSWKHFHEEMNEVYSHFKKAFTF